MNITNIIPNELISKAAEYLTSKERCAARCACKSFNQNLQSFCQKDIPYIDAELIKKLNQRLVECLGKRFLSTVPCIGVAGATDLQVIQEMERKKLPLAITKSTTICLYLRLTNHSKTYPKLTELIFGLNEKQHTEGYLDSDKIKKFTLSGNTDIYSYVSRLIQHLPCGNISLESRGTHPEPREWYYAEGPCTKTFGFLGLKERSMVSLAQ